MVFDIRIAPFTSQSSSIFSLCVSGLSFATLAPLREPAEACADFVNYCVSRAEQV